MTVVPAAWMQPCRMKALVAHWTAGGHSASDHDKECYHVLIEGDGRLIKGDHDISDNVNTADDDYAAHTRGFNTGVIGVSMACMLDAKEAPFNGGPFPMTKTQFDKMILVIGDLCKFYRIPVTPQTVMSHAEVQVNVGRPQRQKWDFTRLPFDQSMPVGAKVCGDRMRKEVSAVLATLT